MCKFCDELFTGDCNSLITEQINNNGGTSADIDIFIIGNMLELYVAIEPMGDDIICKTRLPINYCPACGKELKPELVEEEK